MPEYWTITFAEAIHLFWETLGLLRKTLGRSKLGIIWECTTLAALCHLNQYKESICDLHRNERHSIVCICTQHDLARLQQLSVAEQFPFMYRWQCLMSNLCVAFRFIYVWAFAVIISSSTQTYLDRPPTRISQVWESLNTIPSSVGDPKFPVNSILRIGDEDQKGSS